MSRYRLIALDMDGTLLNKSHTISEQNRHWIKQAGQAGIAVSSNYLSSTPPLLL
jgi:hydroxymethylpyrimidine pyrophosphatase-like HAD family hydrolase